MKRLTFLLLSLLPLFAMAQIPAVNDTTLFTGSTPFTPQFRYKNITLSGVNYRIPQVYNSILGKYDTYVTTKYLGAFYAPLVGGGYIQNKYGSTSVQANSKVIVSDTLRSNTALKAPKLYLTNPSTTPTGNNDLALINSNGELAVPSGWINYRGVENTFQSFANWQFIGDVSSYPSTLGNAGDQFIVRDTITGIHKYLPFSTIYKDATLDNVNAIYGFGDSMTAAGIYEATLDSLLGNRWKTNVRGANGSNTTDFLSRIQSEVFSNGDAKYIILLGGINDISQGYSYATIIANLQSLYTQAHNAGIKVIAVTLLPYNGSVYWTSPGQTILNNVNTWIKTTATNVDYVVDAYAFFNDPSNPQHLLAIYDSGDHLHPNTLGYKKLGELIYNNATFTLSTTPLSLGITKSTVLNQDVSTESSPNFKNVYLNSYPAQYGTGALNGGRIFYNNLQALSFRGTGNTLVGVSNSGIEPTGTYNTKAGFWSLDSLTTGEQNTGVGAFSLYNLKSGIKNTAFGYQSGWSSSANNLGVYLGFQAGYYETGSNKLFIDNNQRSNEADARVRSMIYGVFDPLPSVQELHFNARTSVNGLFDSNDIISSKKNSTASAGFNATNSNAAGYSTVEFLNTGANGKYFALGLGGHTSAEADKIYLYNFNTSSTVFDIDQANKLTYNGVINLKNYTVATLPAGVRGDSAYVTDALAPTYLVTVVGGGSIVTPVFYNGSSWVAH